VAFNACAIKWVFRMLQNDGIHDLVAGNLGCEKSAPFGKICIGKLHESTAGHHRRPFVFHSASFLCRVVWSAWRSETSGRVISLVLMPPPLGLTDAFLFEERPKRADLVLDASLEVFGLLAEPLDTH
jgi:hypothetical protein